MNICPNCGSKVELVKLYPDPEDGVGPGFLSGVQVICRKCGVRGPYVDTWKNKNWDEVAISLWDEMTS